MRNKLLLFLVFAYGCMVHKTLQSEIFKEVSIIYKPFRQKNNNELAFKEVYIRYNNYDYFVKFCKSAVTRNELEKYLSKIGKVQKVKLSFTIFDGYWDICDSNYGMQSRIGKYVVIRKIKKK